jgi:hypothetical protein
MDGLSLNLCLTAQTLGEASMQCKRPNRRSHLKPKIFEIFRQAHPLAKSTRESQKAPGGRSENFKYICLEFDEQFIKDRTQTRTRTRTSEPFLAWVGFSRLKHACSRTD